MDIHIDITANQDAGFALFAGSTYELTVGGVSIHMSAEQFQQLCENLRPWIVEDQPVQAEPVEVEERALRGVMTDVMVEKAWRAGRAEYSRRVKLSREWDEPNTDDIASMRAALEAAVEWAAPMKEAPVSSRPEWFDKASAALRQQPKGEDVARAVEECAARLFIAGYLYERLGAVPPFSVAPEENGNWAFWVDSDELPSGAQDTTSYLHSDDLTIEWYGTSWEPDEAPTTGQQEADARDDWQRMFEAAVASLGEISAALGIDPEEAACANGNELILAAIAASEARAHG